MIYSFLGPDGPQKESKISELKQKSLSSNAYNFDYENLSSRQLDPATLKKALVALPALATKRLILIRACHDLDAVNKELIVEFFAAKPTHLILILESNELTSQDSFIKKIAPYAKLIESARPPAAVNVFDMTRAMSRRNLSEALQLLSDILAQDVHPLQIMGGMVWFWGKSRETLPKEKFEKGLLVLQEADLNIKRSRLQPAQAVEVAVVKLCSL